MPTFDTPEPISVTVELGVGDIRIAASERVDTVVDVRPSDPSKRSDVTAAEQTSVEYANGSLVVKAPKGWRPWTPWGGHGSTDVQIDLPAGSQVNGVAGVAALHCTGRIGGCRYRTGIGDVAVDVAVGRVEITTAGAVRIGGADGPAVVKNRNGDTWIGEVTGEVRVNAANGAISIDLAWASVVAKTANGDVRLGEVVRGAVVAQTALGAVEVGIRDGVAAWLDLETKFGHVQNALEDAERPEPGEDAVDVHARTSMGDITIHRSLTSDTGNDGP